MNKVRKKILLLLVAILFPLCQSRAGSVLIIEKKAGQLEEFKLIEEPVLTLEGSRLLIKSNTIETSYDRSEINRFYFAESTTCSHGDRPAVRSGNTNKGLLHTTRSRPLFFSITLTETP